MNKNSWLKPYIKQENIQAIEAKLAEVERSTSGEIVPMVVHRSSTIGHVPLTLLFFILALLAIFDIDHVQRMYTGESYWPLLTWPLIAFLFVRLLAPKDWVQRLLTSDDDRLSQAEMRAEVEFWEHGLHKTDGSTGVLLFVSLMEHKAVVLADETIAKKLPPETWQTVVKLMIEGVKKQNLGQGLIDAIEKCGEILAPHFPIQPDDVNELPNKLIIQE